MCVVVGGGGWVSVIQFSCFDLSSVCNRHMEVIHLQISAGVFMCSVYCVVDSVYQCVCMHVCVCVYVCMCTCVCMYVCIVQTFPQYISKLLIFSVFMISLEFNIVVFSK